MLRSSWKPERPWKCSGTIWLETKSPPSGDTPSVKLDVEITEIFCNHLFKKNPINNEISKISNEIIPDD